MPEPDLALEVDDADHDLSLGVVARHGGGAAVAQHGGACVRHSHHAPVLTHRILECE
jgi:hypothetical protein